jgi:hypothetical protein
MKKVNIWAYYPIGHMLHPLTEIKEDPTLDDIFLDLWLGQTALNRLLKNDDLPMSLCLPTVNKLLATIKGLLNEHSDSSRKLQYSEYINITRDAKELETLLKAELENLDTYFVSTQMGYKTSVLISTGEELFYDSLRTYISDDVKEDLRSAARCLAFELPTAVGFHILRAVEGMVLDVLDAKGVPRPKKPSERGLAKYIEALKTHVDSKILLPLDQIRSLHRNELMHPDVTLSMEEAASLFEVSKAAMTTLLLELKKQKEKPKSDTSEPAPAAGLVEVV